MVKNSVSDNSISYRFYAKNEYFNFFTLDKYWQVTPKDIYAEVINDIKAKKQVHIDSDLTECSLKYQQWSYCQNSQEK